MRKKAQPYVSERRKRAREQYKDLRAEWVEEEANMSQNRDRYYGKEDWEGKVK